MLAVQADLNRACLALTQGQHLDIAFETRDEVHEASYLEMVEGKTAALLTAATSIGARVAGAGARSGRAHGRLRPPPGPGIPDAG